MEEKSQERKNIFKTWLETLQQESWQLELLISGLALFGVFEAKGLLDSFEAFINVQFLIGVEKTIIYIFLFLLKGSWYIFLINLLIHIVLRGLWIGAIGLRYVSQDINYDELKFSNYFRKLYTRKYESFDDYIEDLEKICSVIFAYTFLLFFILISACLIVLWPGIFFSFLESEVATIISMLYIFIGFIVFIDFIFLNPLKRAGDGIFTRIYGIVFRFYSTITLSFIFRPILLNFLDNKFTKKLFLFSIPYGIAIILVLPSIKSETYAYMPNFKSNNLKENAYDKGSVNPYNYDDLRPNDYNNIRYLSLKNFKLKSDVFEFFLTHLISDSYYFEKFKGISEINRKGIVSIFNKKKTQDSVLLELNQFIKNEQVNYVREKNKNIENRSKNFWYQEYKILAEKNNKLLRDYFRHSVDTINKSFKDLNSYYIDGVDISSEVSCLISQHQNLGERGWSCFINLEDLDNGIHYIKIIRGVYDRTNNVINKVELEIPFILDKI